MVNRSVVSVLVLIWFCAPVLFWLALLLFARHLEPSFFLTWPHSALNVISACWNDDGHTVHLHSSSCTQPWTALSDALTNVCAVLCVWVLIEIIRTGSWITLLFVLSEEAYIDIIVHKKSRNLRSIHFLVLCINMILPCNLTPEWKIYRKI